MKNFIIGLVVIVFLTGMGILAIEKGMQQIDEQAFIEIHGEPEADSFHWKD